MPNQKVKQSRQKVKQKGQDLFDWWNNKATLRPGDEIPTVLQKIGIRILGILLMIIFSPILLAIFILVIAVSL